MLPETSVTRRFRRAVQAAVLSALVVSVGPAVAATFEVSTTLDKVDLAPGDGQCLNVDGLCSLRAAVMETNALPGADVVRLGEGIFPLVLFNDSVLCGEAHPTPSAVAYVDSCSDLDVTDDLRIEGAGAYRTWIDGIAIADHGNSGLLDVAPGVELTVERLALVRGRQLGSGGALRSTGGLVELRDVLLADNVASFAGGAIDASDGTLTVVRSHFAENWAKTAAAGGGAIHHFRSSVPGGTSLLVLDSTFADNIAGEAGNPHPESSDPRGGAISLGAHVTARLDQVTLVDNTAMGPGGGIFVDGAGLLLEIAGSTIVRNGADGDGDATEDPAGGGGGLFVEPGSRGVGVTLRNTILAENVEADNAPDASPDCDGSLALVDHSLVGDPSHCTWSSGAQNLVGVDPELGGFGHHGGPVPTVALLPTSPAIDHADDSHCPSSDARGFFRFIDLECDLGAWESGHVPTFHPQLELDRFETDLGNGSCDAEMTSPVSLSVCTVRAAVQEASALAVPLALVNVAAGSYNLNQGLAGEDDGAEGDLDVTTSGTVVVRGAGARETFLQGSFDRVIDVDPHGTGAILRLEEITVRNGTTSHSDGGGNVLVRGTGRLEAFAVAFEDGTAEEGGGLAVRDDGSADVDASTFRGNLAEDGGAQGGSGDGGAIFHDGEGDVTVSRSTFVDNRAQGSGGALAGEGRWIVGASTIVDNVADDDADGSGGGGGIALFDESAELEMTVVASNVDRGGEEPDCVGAVDSSPPNFVGADTACGFLGGDVTGTPAAPLDPLLGPLGDHGGGTDTAVPEEGSPLVDVVGAAFCPETDQRGSTRPMDGDGDGLALCDLGAVERGEVPIFADGFESGDTTGWAEAP